MKSLKLLAFALVGMLLFACSSNDEQSPVTPGSGNKKTVTISLSGLVTSAAQSKSISANKSTAGVINLNDVTVLLTDGTNIYMRKTIASTSATDFAAITGASGYIFHELDPAINKVIILGNTTGESINYTNVASVKASIMRAADEQDKSDVLLYGENTLTLATEPLPNGHPETPTDYYTTTVNLNALVARLEIGKIQCADLGTTYSSFDLVGLGLVDIYQQTSVDGTTPSPKLFIYTGSGSLGLIYKPGELTPPTGGYEFGNAPALAWAYDAISPAAPFTSSSSVYYAGGASATNSVFAYNFIPVIGQFPNVKLRLNNVTRADGNPTNFSWVSTKYFSGVDATHPKAGYIYQYDLVFNEINIGPWDPEAKICVGVNVTVSSWVIQALTPTFY